MESILKEAKKVVGVDTRPPKQTGDGDPQKEKACENFKVFMACTGYVSNEKRIRFLKSGSTIKDAVDAFGREMRQSRVFNADEYEISPHDSLWQHSKNCNVSLVFRYDANQEWDGLRKTGSEAIENVQQVWSGWFGKR